MPSLIQSLTLRIGQPKRIILYNSFPVAPFTLLDVGCGNNSYAYLKGGLPNCRYHGLDRTRDYNISADSFHLMEAFYEVDLEKGDLSMIPDAHFDAILLVHVVEHLRSAPQVLTALTAKLKPSGIIYVEWPHERSLRLPSMRDTLNFHDDPTHVKLWASQEVTAALSAGNVTTVKAGTRRNWWYLVFSPFLIPWRAARRGYFSASDIWDHVGFAQYVLGRKITNDASGGGAGQVRADTPTKMQPSL